MEKIKKTFYLTKETAELLRKHAYERREPMGRLVEEAIKAFFLEKKR